MNVGFIHPGEMGAVLASAAECPVMWASEARSDESRRRARENGVVDVGTTVHATRSTMSLLGGGDPNLVERPLLTFVTAGIKRRGQ